MNSLVALFSDFPPPPRFSFSSSDIDGSLPMGKRSFLFAWLFSVHVQSPSKEILSFLRPDITMDFNSLHPCFTPNFHILWSSFYS